LANFFQHLLRFLIHLGYFGPFVMGILDSSFLFVPFGNDLLVVGMVARHHEGYLVYVLSAACGSVAGVALLDLVARKAGEEGIKKVAGENRFKYLHKKIGQKGTRALVVACLAPPPFPFTMVVAIASALDYSRKKLFAVVFLSRAARFLFLGFLAMRFGPAILRIAKTDTFKWVMTGFIFLCVAGSVFSAVNWWRKGRTGPKPTGKPQPASS
jgi:membrane protein YqaA with SNARE-associated domain